MKLVKLVSQYFHGLLLITRMTRSPLFYGILLMLFACSDDDTVISPDLGNLTVHPNPATTSITFSFDLHQADQVSIEVFNLNGRAIRQIETQKGLQPGRHHVRLDIHEDPDGIYISRITTVADTTFIRYFKDT